MGSINEPGVLSAINVPRLPAQPPPLSHMGKIKPALGSAKGSLYATDASREGGRPAPARPLFLWRYAIYTYRLP